MILFNQYFWELNPDDIHDTVEVDWPRGVKFNVEVSVREQPPAT